MAPKKKVYNGFSVFMKETQQKLANQGKNVPLSSMPDFCKKEWEEMSDGMKAKYKERSKQLKKADKIEKYTSIGEKVEDVKKQSEDSKIQTDVMYSYIEEMVRVNSANYFLSKQKFILIHVNPYACEKEGFYFPAEISMAEFSLENGLIRIFHQLIGFDKDRTKAPVAPTADINTHAKNNHLINTFSRLPNNYTEILLKIIGFIIQKDVDETILSDPALELPPIFTAHSAHANEIMVTNSSLFQLYSCAVDFADKDDYNNLLRVYHLDKLFMEMKNTSHSNRYPNSDDKALPSVAMATESLTKDMFSTIKSIGCKFHEKLEHAHVCSNYYVCKWIYILSTHCCQYYDIKFKPGHHYDFDLTKAGISVEECLETLDVSQSDFFIDDTPEKKSTLTENSFPALGGKSSKAVEQPVWSKPEYKANTHDRTVISRNDKTVLSGNNDFPPLCSSQQTVSENKPIVENNWRKNVGRGRGVVIQAQSNNATQLDKNSKDSVGRKGNNPWNK